MRHEGTVKVKRRSREASGDIADCGFRPGAAYSPEGLQIADLTATTTARPATTKRNEPRISRTNNSQAGIPIPNREAVRPVDASVRRPYPTTSVPSVKSAASVQSLPNQSGFRCPRNAVFLGLLRLFAENHHKLLTINHLQLESSVSN